MTRQSVIHIVVVVALLIGAFVVLGRLGKGKSSAPSNASSPPSR